MKRILFSFLAATLVIGLFSCSNSKKSGETSTEGTEVVQEEAPETADDAVSQVDAGRDAFGRMNSQMEQLGIELSEEQQRQLQEVSGRFDLNSATNAEQRKALRQQLQQEMYNILTPEQQAVYDGQRQNRNQGN